MTNAPCTLQAKWPQEVVKLGDVVGGLTAEAATRLGLREGLPVAQGGADAFVGMSERERDWTVRSSFCLFFHFTRTIPLSSGGSVGSFCSTRCDYAWYVEFVPVGFVPSGVIGSTLPAARTSALSVSDGAPHDLFAVTVHMTT